MSADVTLPDKLRDVEQVRSVRTPAKLEYTYTAGQATTRFLNGIAEGKIFGERAPGGKVYVPSRGADPELGQPTSEQVELPHKGTLTSFCVVNVAFYGQGMEIPYTAGLILLDGADLPMMCLLQEVDVKDVRIGMRLEAVWVDDADLRPNLESIKYFRPIDEPDVEVRQPGKGVTW
ncbi:MAG: Zn-ribbon domain-containing OB-fold protein [Acidimicrobiales bacterium]